MIAEFTKLPLAMGTFAAASVSGWFIWLAENVDSITSLSLLAAMAATAFGSVWVSFRHAQRWVRSGYEFHCRIVKGLEGIENISERLAFVEARQSASDLDGANAVFECDTNGHNTYVSQSYADLTEIGDRMELMGHGWMAAVPGPVLDMYNSMWPRAFKRGQDTISVQLVFNCLRHPGKYLIADVVMHAVRIHGKHVGYTGRWEPIESIDEEAYKEFLAKCAELGNVLPE
jgi:PAS domain-containing protein